MILTKNKILNNLADKWWGRVLIFLILYLPVFKYFHSTFREFFGQDIPRIFIDITLLIPPLIFSALLEGFRTNSKWHYFGLTIHKDLFRQVYQVLLITLSGFIVFGILFFILGSKPHFDLDLSTPYYLLLIIYLLVSSLLEEIIFRGIIFQALTQRFGFIASSVVLSFSFAAFHYSNPNITFISFVNIFMAGIFFSLIYFQTKSLITCWLSHFLWNFSSAFLIGSSVSGYDYGLNFIWFDFSSLPFYLSGGDFGIEGGLVTTIVLILDTFLIMKFVKPSPFIESMLLKRDYSPVS